MSGTSQFFYAYIVTTVKGILVKVIIVILQSRILIMYSIYSLYWASIQSSIQPSIIPNMVTELGLPM
jgi:hypothetical protein